jgi:hypothetical protein
MNQILDTIVEYLPAFTAGLIPTALAFLATIKAWLKNNKLSDTLNLFMKDNANLTNVIAIVQENAVKAIDQMDLTLKKIDTLKDQYAEDIFKKVKDLTLQLETKLNSAALHTSQVQVLIDQFRLDMLRYKGENTNVLEVQQNGQEEISNT